MATSLKEQLRETAKAGGARFFGVADLGRAREFIVQQGGDFLASYPFAVSIGYRLLDGVVDEVQRHSDPMAVSTYRYYVYEVVNLRLDSIALDVAAELEKAGHRATVVPSSLRVDNNRLVGLFSHKLAAHLAGLGWIGKSALLVTPECGPRLRFSTVLTDAPLPACQPFQGEKCGRCTMCVRSCPAQAFTGVAYTEVRPRGDLFNAQTCNEYLLERKDVIGFNACGLCVSVCPYGRKKTGTRGRGKT